ncbi:major urinary protein 20-like [Trichosurus vulpecula]|uniref:major urinary protein 20-like n=1 Tax=Trichosurus vulpecula TaxID=9337 RepID=UPI00186B3F2B|nr:major urinary protein 20-like [Trichosurus vulpecula]
MGGEMWGIRIAVLLLNVGQAPICSFQVQNNITLMPDFNISQAKGPWNSIIWAMNERLSDPDREDVKASLTIFSPFANGNVNLQTTITLSDGVCTEVNVTYTHGNKSGQYKSNDGSPYYFQVIDTDYENYGIIYIGNNKNKDDFHVKLYGRTKVVTDEVLKKFQEVTRSLGILGENLVVNEEREWPEREHNIDPRPLVSGEGVAARWFPMFLFPILGRIVFSLLQELQFSMLDIMIGMPQPEPLLRGFLNALGIAHQAPKEHYPCEKDSFTMPYGAYGCLKEHLERLCIEVFGNILCIKGTIV